jgi:NosR/NirI family nitrous oxide reductase transcriptional regulator
VPADRSLRRPAAYLPGVLLLATVILLLSPSASHAQDRVPRPQFQSGYEIPQLVVPSARSPWLEYLDVAVLVLSLAGASWLVLRGRSREGIFLLGIFAIAYFGFFRKGCVCPVGSLQNVALAAFNTGYTVPVTVLLFFSLPLITALFFGRTFCAAVCPLGAIQDAVVLKPLRLPRWLSVPLGFLPVVYLGLAVLLAATGAQFIICRFDPFVSLYRLGGSVEILALGACFLLLGTVVARPYCRFLCPYGVLLGWLSRLSHRHATITPDTCIQCRLCEESCPFDAIRPPTPTTSSRQEPGTRRAFTAALVALPLLVAAGALGGRALGPTLSRIHPEVRLALQVEREDAGLTSETTLESETFRASKTTKEELLAEAARARKAYDIGGPILGGFIALVFALRYLDTFRRRRREDYEPDRYECFSCGRCFSYCPREHVRLAQEPPRWAWFRSPAAPGGGKQRG